MFGKLRKDSRRAMTLSELSVATAVSAIILTALIGFTVYASRTFAAMGNYVDLEQRSQYALDTMVRDIRTTQGLSNYGTITVDGVTMTNEVTFTDYDGYPLTFVYTNNSLLRTKTNDITMLLTNVDYLSFQIFQRNTVGGSFNQFPTQEAGKCKLIAVSWICSRSILGSRMNTESVQTAKIVIRKE
jgi:hypothetical protein